MVLFKGEVMKIALVGPELEENMALRYLYASLSHAGYTCRIFDFHSSEQIESIVSLMMEFRPQLIGLSMVFTSRAREYISLSEMIKKRMEDVHITAGGHFASFHAEKLLSAYKSLDSVIHGEGEHPIVQLARNISNPQVVNNISIRTIDGSVIRTLNSLEKKPDIDALPWPVRTPPLHMYMGLPIANIIGSRGCYGNCNFCSIAAWHRENGGARFRFRNPSAVAEEMAYLYHDLGVRIYNFHDDNFFLPDENKSIRRIQDLRRYLDKEKVGRIALQIKARPDSISEPVVAILKKAGLFRVFLGVESNAVAGLKTLGRGITRECNYNALNILQRNNIHTTFNLLMFDPEMTPDDFSDNIAMIESYPPFPMNFGRVEVYSGTPLELRLRRENRLTGDYFGHSYQIKDPSMQAAFEIFRTVFTGRNFQADGLNHLSMRLDYYYHLLGHFFPHLVTQELTLKTKGLISDLNKNSAFLLRSISNYVQDDRNDNSDGVQTFADNLKIWREGYDSKSRTRCLDIISEIEQTVQRSHVSRNGAVSGIAAAAAAAVIIASSCNCDKNPLNNDWHVSEMIAVPGDSIYWEKVPLLKQWEAQAVSSSIENNYHREVRLLTRKYGYKDTLFSVDMFIDTAGIVKANRIRIPALPDSSNFTSELNVLVSKWAFPNLTNSGKCTIDFTVKTVLYPSGAIENDTLPWHVCEFIGTPPDTAPAKPEKTIISDTVWNSNLWSSFYVFDETIIHAIENEIHSNYYLELKNRCRELYSDTIEYCDVDIILDAFGTMTMFRATLSDGKVLDAPLEEQLLQYLSGWEFPLVKKSAARAGKCSIRIKFD
jgi:radical SAM superfamily enzyme YgiQ (UPF0313 family)